MPSASNRQRVLMEKWFGDSIAESGPIRFLESHGYILTRQWFWQKPVSSHTVSEYEWECMAFLVDEWDFGGILEQ